MDKQRIKQILIKAIDEVKPEKIIKKKIKFEKDILFVNNKKFFLKNYKNIYLCGSGKASIQMAKALKSILGLRLKAGIIISNFEDYIDKIEVLKGSHPIPDESSLKSTEKLCDFLKNMDTNDFFIYLLSGGTSAMLEIMPENVSLADLKNFTEILLKSGMTIQEMNVLRKKLSKVKGGKLLNYVNCNGICFVFSDVIGDDLRYIGSGPLYAGKDFIKPEKILKKYNIENKIPENIKHHLLKKDKVIEKRKIPHFIIANNLTFLKTIQYLLKKELNLDAIVLTDSLKGEAREVAKVVVSLGKFQKKPLIFGGETTVTVKGNGLGGRNQEMVLSALIEIQDEKYFIFTSIASDGIDGPTNAAGAIIDKYSIKKFKNLKLNPENFLLNNDSYNFFKKIDDLIITGKTGTNLLDATFIYISDS